MRRAVVVLSVLASIALLGLSSAAFAADRVVHVKVRADSEHPGMEAFRAMDGNAGSIWHSRWRYPTTKLPHEIVVDLGEPREITGFTYRPRAHAAGKSAIKDYEVYLSDRHEESVPLAKGSAIAKGAFVKKQGDNVVKFDAPVKGRYFRLRALSNVDEEATWAGMAELRIHCEGVKFVGKPWSLLMDFPKAGEEAIRLIEGFPLLRKLLEMPAPWKWGPKALKDRLFRREMPGALESALDFGEMELACGTQERPGLYIDRRVGHDWRTTTSKEWGKKRMGDWPGQKVWDHYANVTDYYVYNPARPLIRLHLGYPPTGWAHMMKVTYPELPDSARKDVPARIEKIVKALEPYGAKRLPLKHNHIRQYLLPGGTRMTVRDKTTGTEVKVKIDFEPAEPTPSRAALRAFPGAEGYGAFTPGGRGGKVYIVTTLEDYLPEDRPGMKKGFRGSPGFPPIPKEDPIPGSLREAVEAEGPRIVLFGVSGTIALKAPLRIKHPYLTLVGHTAPGEGVQIRNWWITTHGSNIHDVVLRYLRIRVGEVKGPGNLRRVRAEQSEGISFSGMNIIVDHCEFAYGNDEIVSLGTYPSGTLYRGVRALSSFQWNYTYGAPTASTHDKGNHSMGYMLGFYGFLSFHHNLTAHITRRNPRAGGLGLDWRNNVLYHYQGSGYGGEPNDIMMNYIGNTQKRGGWGHAFLARTGDVAYLYGRDNVGVSNPPFRARPETIMDRPWNSEPVKTDPAKVAYEKILKYGGADLPVRDVITTFISEGTRNNTGNYCGTPADWPHGGYATYKPAKPAPDTDKDGMPDWWEKKHGLNPKNASDNAADKDKDGYTNVEEYINDTDPTKFVDYRKPENNVHSLHRKDTIHRRKER